MKPSGIEWIGDIPDDWEVRRVKNTGKLIGGSAFPDEYQGVKNEEIPFIKVKSLAEDPISRNGKDSISESIRSKLNAEKFIIGSVVFAKVGAALLLQRFRILEFESCIDNNMMGFIPLVIEPRFFKYVTVLFDFSYFVNPGTVPSINQEQIGNIKIPFPPLKTQQKIADYLDEKCGEIDATIAKQKESIEKLKAYKQSLISETVTKGLDKSSPLKPSGIEWIGDIPSHWEIKKLKFLVSLIDNKTKDGHSISLENIESGTGKLIETENTYDGEGISFKENDLLFGKLRPYLAKVYLSALKGRALGDFYVMRANKGTNPNFLKFVLLSDWFIKIVDSSTYGTKMPRASWDFTGGMRIPLPPISEQDCISSYLETKCSEVDTFIIEKQNIIQKLDAYKKSLIFECVTGKCSILGEICNGRRAK